jgi:hypothetical protein
LTGRLLEFNNYNILEWLKVNSWLSSEMKQVLMHATSQTFSPPPHELIGRVEHYLKKAIQDIDPTAAEAKFNGYKRYLGLE